jgi:hypothetical protein
VNEDISKAKFASSFSKFLLHCYQMAAGMIAREHWRRSQEFSSVEIIPPWFFMLISPGG